MASTKQNTTVIKAVMVVFTIFILGLFSLFLLNKESKSNYYTIDYTIVECFRDGVQCVDSYGRTVYIKNNHFDFDVYKRDRISVTFHTNYTDTTSDDVIKKIEKRN